MDRALAKVPGLSEHFGSFSDLRRAAAIDPSLEKWKHLQFFKGDFDAKYEKYAQLLMPPLAHNQWPNAAHWAAYEKACELAARDAWAESLLSKLVAVGKGTSNGNGNGNGTAIFGKVGQRMQQTMPQVTGNDNRAEMARVLEIAKEAERCAGGKLFASPRS